ncbi:hypothetical protein ES703_90150 [subsurface metagenome]
MSKATDIGLFIIGGLALICANALAFVFDAEWINVAVSIDALFIGALITKFLNGKQ